MKKILLLNERQISHYRVPVYNYLSDYLIKNKFAITVVSEGIQAGNPHTIRFNNIECHFNSAKLIRLIINTKPDAIIFWIKPSLNNWTVLYLAKLMKIKVIHWGHRRPDPPNVYIKTILINIFEHCVDDAVILYAQHLSEYVWKRFQSKTFVANNTLDLTIYKPSRFTKEDIKAKHGIFTSKNIICMGRMQKRKRVDDLIQSFRMLNMEEVGLILVGPDTEGILRDIEGANIFKLGPVYGDESLDLLSASDIYCLPGAIGLSIVDAFYCGLPVITENVRHGPEIMYLKNEVNGFIVPKGDTNALATKLKILLTDDILRNRFSQAARNEIMTSGHIDRMCEGFNNALQYVFKS
jgi:glycosyltransferase involved in cell wall biosynthesis